MKHKEVPKRKAKYPGPLIFTDGAVTFTISKGACVGTLDFEMEMGNGYSNEVKLKAGIYSRQFLQLQDWIDRWRKSHEYNWGPIQK